MTDIQKIKLLVFGNESDTTYTDSQAQAFLDIGDSSVLRGAGFMMRSLSSLAASGASVRIGDWSQSTNASDLAKAADNFFELDANTPAFAIIEQSVSEFAALEMVRNQILRELA